MLRIGLLPVAATLLLTALLLTHPLPTTSGGEGVAIGVSGSFSRFNYTVVAGSVISSPDIYIYIINQGGKELNIVLNSTVIPKTPFLRLAFSENNFTLRPGEHRVVYVSIVAEEGVVPGRYTVYADVIAYHEEKGAVIPVPVGSLKATVNVVGASSTVLIRVIDISGNPVRSEVKLVRITAKANYTVAYSKEGVIEAEVAPGDYFAAAYLAGRILNKTFFSIGPNEHKNISLIVSTVYFSYFSVAPALNAQGIIGFAQITSIVNNLYAPLPNVSLVLHVYFNGRPLENVTIAAIPLLPKGRSEYKYSYVPSGGWRSGVYGFVARLYSEGVLMAETGIRELNVTARMVGMAPPTTATAATPTTSRVIPLPGWTLLVLIVLILVISALLLLLAALVRRRRKKEEGLKEAQSSSHNPQHHFPRGPRKAL